MKNLAFIMFTLMMIIMTLIHLMNKFNKTMNKKNFFTSIECGFNQMNNKHMPLYNNFFIILIIFLIFDMEFFLLIPLSILMKTFNWMKFNIFLISTILFIYFSMLYEIKMNCINWIK